MGITLINPKNQKTYGGDDKIPDENYYNGVFFSSPALAQMFRDNKWSTTLNVGTPPDEPKPEPERKWHWIDDDRIPSQAEIDFYTAMDEGEEPEITQEHLDEIGMGEGGEGHKAEDLPKTPAEVKEDNAPENQPAEDDPGFTTEHNAYIDPMTGEKQFQTREAWSASIVPDYSTGITGKGIGRQSAEGASIQSGNLRRIIRKFAPSLISARA